MTDRTYEMRSGHEILKALDKASKGVQEASSELSRLVQSFYEADVDPETGEVRVLGVGLRFDSALRDELAFIYEDAIENKRRPPAEDIRQAMAQRAVQTKRPELYAEYYTTKARIDALRSWLANQKATISANQSLRKGEAT